MKNRLLCVGLVAVVCQLISTGCCWRYCYWREKHPCRSCTPAFTAPVQHPVLHPILTRRALVKGDTGAPVVGMPACHGCATPGIPVGFGGLPSDVVPITHPPTITPPTPITPGGPMIVPSYELHQPMPAKPGQ
ncbi:MAG: hypothetical protein L0241_25495 [Planctomycetia bacterium]|nr:hypothetical protein [Planctomycetia bacterium]